MTPDPRSARNVPNFEFTHFAGSRRKALSVLVGFGMTGEVCFFVEADASSGLLCRLLGFFAQLDLPAPAMRVDVSGDSMAIEARLANFGETLMPTVAYKMANLVGVRAVDVHEMNG